MVSDGKWWLIIWLVAEPYPSEKWWKTRQLGWMEIPNWMDVPNHQSDDHVPIKIVLLGYPPQAGTNSID